MVYPHPPGVDPNDWRYVWAVRLRELSERSKDKAIELIFAARRAGWNIDFELMRFADDTSQVVITSMQAAVDDQGAPRALPPLPADAALRDGE